MMAKNPARSRFGSNADAAASISLSNLVPSSIVIPTMYGSASFHSKGIRTSDVSNLSRNLSGSTAAGCILSFTSAITIWTGIGPVFLTVAWISDSTNSTFSIVTSGKGVPRSKRSDPGPKMYASIKTTNMKGIIPLATSFALDVLLMVLSLSSSSFFSIYLTLQEFLLL